MRLEDAIAAAGMTPPARIVPGRWMRFPGAGKGRSNRSGWCRLITPTLAVFGDWSSNFTATWKDDAHQDNEQTRRMLEEARDRERIYAAEQRKRQKQTSLEAQALVRKCEYRTHWYLERKGFPHEKGLVHDDQLVIPMRDIDNYTRVLSAQLIAPDGTKRFLPGGRAKGAIHRLGPARGSPVLCEGYATGMSIAAALKRLPGEHPVMVCFSANNLEFIATRVPRTAVVAADNDMSATGERAAIATGLRWTMPYEVGTDWNDLHAAMGLHVVVERMRELLR